MAEAEVNQDFIRKMESPSDSAVWITLPSDPQACVNPPHMKSSRKQSMSATLREQLRKQDLHLIPLIKWHGKVL